MLLYSKIMNNVFLSLKQLQCFYIVSNEQCILIIKTITMLLYSKIMNNVFLLKQLQCSYIVK